MIERDRARLRFLWVRFLKGDRLYQDDLDFILRMESELKPMLESIQTMREGMQND